VLLVARGAVPAATARALRHLQPRNLTLVDAVGGVSDAVMQELRGYTTGEVMRVPAV
jgi:hypothetical protein